MLEREGERRRARRFLSSSFGGGLGLFSRLAGGRRRFGRESSLLELRARRRFFSSGRVASSFARRGGGSALLLGLRARRRVSFSPFSPRGPGEPAGRAGASGLGRSDFRAGGSDLGGSDFRSGAGEAEAPTKSQRKYPEESGPFQKNVAGNNAGIIENCRESAYFAENALRQLVKTSPN